MRMNIYFPGYAGDVTDLNVQDILVDYNAEVIGSGTNMQTWVRDITVEVKDSAYESIKFDLQSAGCSVQKG